MRPNKSYILKTNNVDNTIAKKQIEYGAERDEKYEKK